MLASRISDKKDQHLAQFYNTHAKEAKESFEITTLFLKPDLCSKKQHIFKLNIRTFTSKLGIPSIQKQLLVKL